jgi:hypothetical protein
MFGFDGATAMSPAAKADSFSNTGCQVRPALVVFHTLPDAGPTYIVLGWPTGTAIASMREDCCVGPSARHGSRAKGDDAASCWCAAHAAWRSATDVAIDGDPPTPPNCMTAASTLKMVGEGTAAISAIRARRSRCMVRILIRQP